MLVALLRAE